MEPKDSSGRDLSMKVFYKLCYIGKQLERYGYIEASKKPNLFFRKYDLISFFADMRGTEDVPIWKFPVPYFYWAASDDLPYTSPPQDFAQRAALAEVCRLFDVKLRLNLQSNDRRHGPWSARIRDDVKPFNGPVGRSRLGRSGLMLPA